MTKKKAYSLAELLLITGIIGVIASLTIPQLISHYHKKITTICLKAQYTKLLQVLKYAEEDYGEVTTWNLNGLAPTTVPYDTVISDFVHKYISPYYKILNDCGTNCEQRRKVLVCNLNKTNCNNNRNYNRFRYTLYLNDGSCLEFMLDNNRHYWLNLKIFIDINGDSAPNIVGKDIFVFQAGQSTKKLYGADYTDDVILNNRRAGCSLNAADYAGDMCGGLIQKHNWTIPDNYPW